MALGQRIKHLENNVREQEPETRPAINLGDVIRKLGLNPDKVSIIAKEKNQSSAEVIAAELGMPYTDFVRELKLGAQGK